MRIGVDGRYIQDHFPGIGRYTYNLVMHLARIVPQTMFCLVCDPIARNTRYDIEGLARSSNIEIIHTDIPTFSLAEQYQLPRLIRRLQLDLFHSPYYLKPYRLPCPSIVTIYDVISRLYPRYLPSRRARIIYEIATRLALRTSRRIITTSVATRDDLVKYYRVGHDRIVVTPLAADKRFGPISPDEIARVRARYRLPLRYVLYVGINKPHKNLTQLVEAWALLETREGTAGHHLILAGREDPRYPEVRHRIKALNLLEQVRVLGEIPEEDLPCLYAGASWFVFPSLYEGFGLPVLEAMACGTPVVCSNISSLPEIVGDAAITFDPTDVEGMAQALFDALGDPKRRGKMSEKARRRAQCFRWERTAQLTYQCYKEVLTEVRHR